jgi:hypothetical protein
MIYPLVMTNIAMEAMAHRNRWFTVLKNGGSFRGYVGHNQMVYPIIIPLYYPQYSHYYLTHPHVY